MAEAQLAALSKVIVRAIFEYQRGESLLDFERLSREVRSAIKTDLREIVESEIRKVVQISDK
jgi:hypothetical protein